MSVLTSGILTHCSVSVITVVKTVEIHHEAPNEVLSGDNMDFNVKSTSANCFYCGSMTGDSNSDP